MIFFVSDTHFNHPILAKIRNLSVKDHDEMIIANWNSIITRKDEVYHLGDFCFGEHKIIRHIRHKLNGKIHLILGSHDYANRIHNLKDLFTSISDLKTIKIDGQKIILCHYAMRVWAYSHYGSWHLYGHSHGRLEEWGKSFDVGIDAHCYFPISIEKVNTIMENLPDNFNLIIKK